MAAELVFRERLTDGEHFVNVDVERHVPRVAANAEGILVSHATARFLSRASPLLRRATKAGSRSGCTSKKIRYATSARVQSMGNTHPHSRSRGRGGGHSHHPDPFRCVLGHLYKFACIGLKTAIEASVYFN